jgi:hypothetical protein
VANNKPILFSVNAPLNNSVILYEKTWLRHTTPKRTERDELVPSIEEVRSTVETPSWLRRSTHPELGNDSCIFEKLIETHNRILRVPVLFDPGHGYDDANSHDEGVVMTAYYPDGSGGKVGEIFWVAAKDEEGK